MNEAELNLESFLAMSQLMGIGNRPIKEFLTAHKSIANKLQAYDPIKLAGAIGSLLTKPELQSNCYRLEVLLHMVIAQANGRKKPDNMSVARWFNLLEQGLCGRYEDPAEDVFVNSIETPEGNFRILEGLWESSGFYLQRTVNVVTNMPDGGSYGFIRKSVYTLLKLSDESPRVSRRHFSLSQAASADSSNRR